MSKSDKHALSSAEKFGGTPSDYIEIHEMMDSSKSAFGDNRHRAIFHTTLGCYYMQKMFGVDFDEIENIRNKYQLPEKFVDDLLKLMKHNRSQGVQIKNSEGKKVHVRDIAEQHILEDFRQKFIPTLSDFLSNMKLLPWMNNALSSINSIDMDKEKIKKNKVSQINLKIK